MAYHYFTILPFYHTPFSYIYFFNPLMKTKDKPNFFVSSYSIYLYRNIFNLISLRPRNIGFIHLIFPKAAIVHTMRDPMDTLFSCYKHKFDDSGLEWALDFERKLQHVVLQMLPSAKISEHCKMCFTYR
jgi:hypothetical protein